jgi:hypothetical protein
MRNQILAVLLAACSQAVLTAQQAASDPLSFDGFAVPAVPAAEAAGGAGERLPGSAPVGSTEFFRRRGIDGLAPQETDYTLRGLFLNAHGDFIMRRERYNPMVELYARAFPNYSIQHEPGRFDLLQYGADIELPLTVSPDGYLTVGAYFDQRRYTVQDMLPDFDDENFYAAGLNLGFGIFLDDNVMFEVLTKPGAWSDLDGTLHSKDFDFPTRALFTWRTSDDVFVKLGARYNQVYEEAPWLPIIGLGWAISEHFRLDIELPETIEFSWWPDPGLSVLAGTEITGAEYHVRSDTATGEQRDDVQVQEVIVYGGLMWRFSDYLSLMGRAGLTVAGDYKLTTGVAGTDYVDGALDQGFFAELSFGIDF